MQSAQIHQLITVAEQQQMILVSQNERAALYDNISMIKAQAAGLHAIIEKSISDGDIDPDDLHNIANLGTQIKGHLHQLSLVIAELSNQKHGD